MSYNRRAHKRTETYREGVITLNVLLTVEEVAPVLRITDRTLKDMARRNDVPGAVKVGKEWRFRRVALEQLLGEPWPLPKDDNNEARA
jgi:excisionase family DNA binding protein